TVTDDEAPIITAPNVTAKTSDDGTGNCSTIVVFAPTATDNCDGSVNVTTVPASGTVFNKGVTTVTAKATDSPGNSTTTTFTVTVTDDEAPKVSCPGNKTVSTDSGKCSAVVNSIAPLSKSDNCCIPTVTWTAPGATPASGNNDASGTTFPKGPTTVTYTVTDTSGNTSTCSFTVTANDTEAPTISCPIGVTNTCTQVVNKSDATAGDNCSYVVTWTIDGADQGTDTVTLGVGCHTVTWTITDTGGNTASCSQN